MSNRLKSIIPDWFAQLPAGQEALAEAAEADLTQAQSLEAQLEALAEEREETLASLAADVADAAKELTEARAAYITAQRRYGHAVSASMGAAYGFDHRETVLLGQIRELTDNDAIDVFVARLNQEHALLRREGVQAAEFVVAISAGNVPERVDVSNSRSVGRRLVAIVEAIRQANELRFKPVADIAAELEKLYEALPIDEPPQPPEPPTIVKRVKTAYDRQAERIAKLLEVN